MTDIVTVISYLPGNSAEELLGQEMAMLRNVTSLLKAVRQVNCTVNESCKLMEDTKDRIVGSTTKNKTVS